MENVFEEFQKVNQVKNLSPQTLEYYSWNNKAFLNYLADNGIFDIETISRTTIDDFILSEKKIHDNTITINAHIRAVRAFLYYAMERDYLKAFKINLLKQPDKIMNTYSDEDIQKLIAKPTLKPVALWSIVTGL